MRAIAPLTVVVIIAVAVLVVSAGVTLYTYYVNSIRKIEFGSDVIGSVAATFSGSYNAGQTQVDLNINGLTATVNWDGKAVGVVAVGGNYIKVDGFKYYYSAVAGYGVAAQNSCPWHAWLTGATLYDVKVIDTYNVSYRDSSQTNYVTIEYSDELGSKLQVLGINFDVVRSESGKVIKIPIVPVSHKIQGIFAFYYGSTGIFGGCPQLKHYHSSNVSGTIYYSMISS